MSRQWDYFLIDFLTYIQNDTLIYSLEFILSFEVGNFCVLYLWTQKKRMENENWKMKIGKWRMEN